MPRLHAPSRSRKALVAIAFSSVSFLIPGLAQTQHVSGPPLVLKYEATAEAKNPIDAVDAPGPLLFVLEERGRLLAIDEETLQVVRSALVPEAIALTRDPQSGTLFILSMTRRRGPWHTIHSVDPDSFVTKTLANLEEQYAFNENGVGFAAYDRGRLAVNNRYSPEVPALAVVDPFTGEVLARVALPDQKVISKTAADVDARVASRWNTYRFQISNDTLYALNTTTGAIGVVDTTRHSLISSMQVPRFPEWKGPFPTGDGKGVAQTYTAFDLDIDPKGNVVVLYNGRNPLGFVMRRDGQVIRTLEFDQKSGDRLARRYGDVTALTSGRFLLLSEPEGRIDLFSVVGQD